MCVVLGEVESLDGPGKSLRMRPGTLYSRFRAFLRYSRIKRGRKRYTRAQAWRVLSTAKVIK